MLYHLLYTWSSDFSVFNVFRYITFRSIVAFLIAAVVSIIWGYSFINFMKLKQFGQIIRDDGPESHFKKKGTPTMGGVSLLGVSSLVFFFVATFFQSHF